MNFSNEALGEVVRGLRERHAMTQAELGRRAGYGAGAGVSISRLESGLLRPGSTRFAGVAEALELTPEELEAQAAEQTAENEAVASAPSEGAGGEAVGESDGAGPAPSAKELKERERRILQEIDERTKAITDLSEAFNEQHDRARDEFFLRFVEIAAHVEGAPQPDPTQMEEDDAADANAVAAYRIKANATGVTQLLAGGARGAAAGAAVGSAADYESFVAAASLGTASTGAANSGLSGVAATNATLALLGGGTLAAGGAAALAGIFAAPTLVLASIGYLWMAKRNRKRQRELAAKLDEAEAELAATRPGVKALQEILPRATETLAYIATHAGHAVKRWQEQLGRGSMTWDSLGDAEQRRYQDFIDIAAVQIAIMMINVQGLLTTRGSDQDQLIRLADEVLIQSQDIVAAHV